MKDIKLKTYDIASYDIELDFMKQIAPIEKAIEKLNSSHEAKSLKAHKDFLDKEKKSKDTISQLGEKSVVKNQRIERAVENKLKKLESKEHRYKKELEESIAEKSELSNIEKQAILAIIDELHKEEQEQIDEIKQKYKANIESYVEKLDIYNNNFEKNKKQHYKQINKYQEQLNQYIEQIKAFYSDTVQELENHLQSFLEDKNKSDQAIQKSFDETSRSLGTIATTIRKNANLKITDLNQYVDDLKHQYEAHYEPKIKEKTLQIQEKATRFDERASLIGKDLEINILKLEKQLEDLQDSKNKKAKRNILAKIDLFNVRASTTLRYEERLMHATISILKQEKAWLEQTLDFELKNLEKLRIFLLNDQNNLKDTGDYFKNLNVVLKEQLNNFELTNNEYLYKHEQLKADFIKQYTNIFTELKQSTIDLAQTYLEKIADNNHVIDDINKFLDTAEPLKEIEVNRLRENIEINEVQERYKIKYAKQQYEIDTIENTLAYEIKLLEIKTKELLSEYNKEVVDVRSKEVFDKALEKAKLKHARAQEVFKLRLNNTKLERNLLNSKYETEINIYQEHKHLAEIDVRKHNALRSKEIEYAIKNMEIEANYKIEVIHKALEEQLLKLEEQSSKAKYEKDAYSSNLNLEIESKTTEIHKLKHEIDKEGQQRINLIDEALERELREPSKNIVKTEAIIDERLSKLDINNAIFVDFINDSMESFKDDKLSLEQIREIIISNEVIFDKSVKYITRGYEVLSDAMKFMYTIEKQSILNKIAASSDQGDIKKWNKHLQKIDLEHQTNIDMIHQSENDYKTLIRNLITTELEEIKRSNPDTILQLIDYADNSYNKVFHKLTSLQTRLKEDIIQLYEPLTRSDQELIDYANKNAEKAKQIVHDETAAKFAPVEQELQAFIQQKESIRKEFNDTIDVTIKELRSQINHIKNDALKQVQEINDEKDTIINQQLLLKQQISDTEEQAIVEEYEKIDRTIQQLTETYEAALLHLDEKDEEAKKIFDYEDRIYAIAVESATARFNDANVKAENVHLNNMKQYQNQMEQAKQSLDNQEYNNNQQLLQLTKRFEKNIFTVRPRLEESIGDAQKQIDNQIAEKSIQLADLLENNQKITASAETALYSAFQEGADRLSDNLQNYIEKYRVIETEYHNNNNVANNIISENNVTFSNALFELSKNKHAKTLQELLSINTTMYGKEE